MIHLLLDYTGGTSTVPAGWSIEFYAGGGYVGPGGIDLAGDYMFVTGTPGEPGTPLPGMSFRIDVGTTEPHLVGCAAAFGYLRPVDDVTFSAPVVSGNEASVIATVAPGGGFTGVILSGPYTIQYVRISDGVVAPPSGAWTRLVKCRET